MNWTPRANATPLKRQAGAMNAGTMIAGMVVVLILAVGIYFLFLRSPAPPEVSVPVAPPTTPEERGDLARDIVEELRSNPSGVDLAEAYEQAREFQDTGRLADAQLLFFFAARNDYPPAVFDLATMYDPNHFSSENSLMDQPDAAQAFKWYKKAEDIGNPASATRLEELKKWVENAARDGDADAEILLMRWK